MIKNGIVFPIFGLQSLFSVSSFQAFIFPRAAILLRASGYEPVCHNDTKHQEREAFPSFSVLKCVSCHEDLSIA